MNDVTTRIHGEVGTTVHLSILRGSDPIRSFDIVRGDISKVVTPGQILPGQPADPVALAKIVLPDHPTRDQITVTEVGRVFMP